jgi:hypothetical protein
MKRNPVSDATTPPYPRQRGAWAFGLLALGAASVASPGIVGCATVGGGGHGAHACPGDMVEPAPPTPEAAPGPEPTEEAAPTEPAPVDGDPIPEDNEAPAETEPEAAPELDEEG